MHSLYCRVAKLDSRIGSCTVSASSKWEPVFKECESSLGFTGDAANDVFSAWSRLATNSFHRKKGVESPPVPPRPKRTNSLTGMGGKTVKVPVGLIPLERARARTLKLGRADLQGTSKIVTQNLVTASTSGDFPVEAQTDEPRPTISRPINIEDSALCCSYPSGSSYRLSRVPYAPQADVSESPLEVVGKGDSEKESEGVTSKRRSDLEETLRDSFDLKKTIQDYVDKVRVICHVHVFRQDCT